MAPNICWAFTEAAEFESELASSTGTNASARLAHQARLAYQNQVAISRGGIVAVKFSEMLASEDWRTCPQICLPDVEATVAYIANAYFLVGRRQTTAVNVDQLRSLTYSVVDMLGFRCLCATVGGFVIFHKGGRPTAISLTRYKKERIQAPPKLTRHEYNVVFKFHTEALRKAQALLAQVGPDAAASGDDELSSGSSSSVAKRGRFNKLKPHEKKAVQNLAQSRIDSATRGLDKLGEWK